MEYSPNTQTLLLACRKAFRPIVRLLLGSITYQECTSVLKALYVEIASQDYGLRGRPTNISRVALLTGLDRKEVRRLRSQQEVESTALHTTPARLSRVLSAWYQSPEFCTDNGSPLPLPQSGEHPSFESLAAQYGGDIPATTIAKELQRVGAIHIDSKKLVHALTRYYMPLRLDDAALVRSGEVLEDLGNTIRHNLTRDESTASWFEGRATNLQVAARAVPDFQQFLEQEGQALLERVDQWLSRHEAEDNEETVRLGLGVYAIHSSGTPDH